MYLRKPEFKKFQPSLATYQEHIWDLCEKDISWYEYDKAYRAEREKERTKQDWSCTRQHILILVLALFNTLIKFPRRLARGACEVPLLYPTKAYGNGDDTLSRLKLKSFGFKEPLITYLLGSFYILSACLVVLAI